MRIRIDFEDSDFVRFSAIEIKGSFANPNDTARSILDILNASSFVRSAILASVIKLVSEYEELPDLIDRLPSEIREHLRDVINETSTSPTSD